MTDLGRCLPTAFSVLTAVALVQNVAVAKSAPEINQIAQAITVRIAVGQGNGSGILLQKDGAIYTVLTAAHVLKGETMGNLTIMTADDKSHKVIEVRRYQGDVDLAIVKFRSTDSYRLAELGDSNKLAGGMDIYAAGFPAPTRVITEPVFVFRRGQVVANSKRVFKDGYALLYDNSTLPGMSGGPILDEAGKVVAIHGKGDREQDTDVKTGYNAGIPIARFADIASGLGVGITVARTVQSPTLTADDYFLSAYQKDDKGDYRGALIDYNQSIALKPDNTSAYLNRGILKNEKLNDVKGALADFDQSIALNPNNTSAYLNRGILKNEKLNDVNGALADLNQFIVLEPDFVDIYVYRGVMKSEKLNDVNGALADFNQLIALKPDNAEAYHRRGILKNEKLNDAKGALADFNRLIALKPDNAKAYVSRGILKSQKLDDLAGALKDLDYSIKLNPNLVGGYYNRGDFLYMTGRRAEALQDFSKARDISPTDATGLITTGIIAMEQGRLATSINNFNQAIQNRPQFGDAFKYRGLANRRQGNNSQAIQDWRNAAQFYKANNYTRDYQIVRGWLKDLGVNI
jgi:tetratricopeptide (TPR) repeat protein